MPSTYTHYRFGKEVITCLPSPYRKPIEKYRDLYNIGLHGPDILFYYKPLSSNSVNKTGYAMHDVSSDLFFHKASGLFHTCENQDALKAYLYGFICHFALDSTCHPYIEKITHTTGISHSEIETELDRSFMLMDHLDINSYIPIEHIHATDFNSHIIAPCFDTVSEQEVKAALKGMITSHKLLHAPDRVKRNLLYAGLKLTGHFDSMQGLIMKPQPDSQCKKYCLLLQNLYTEAVTTASSLIQQYNNVLEHDAPLSLRFHMTFGAGENWMDLNI